MRTRGHALLLTAGIALTTGAAATTPAHAGTYTVSACAAGGRVWDNQAWEVTRAADGVQSDTVCPTAAQNIDLHVRPGARTPAGQVATLELTAPEGTGIVDFRLNRRLAFANPTPRGTRAYVADYVLGPTAFGPAPGGSDTGLGVVTRASFPALAGYRGDARTLALRVSCPAGGAPCGMGAGGAIDHNLRGTEVVVNDPTSPRVTVVNAGLLAGGQRNGSDPVVLRASDNSGVRRVEILDLTNPAAPAVVGVEDYDSDVTGVRTDTGGGCSYARPKPCPTLPARGENVRPTALAPGQRAIAVRVTDAAGNQTTQGPFPVDVVSPSDRGALNGAEATETARLSAVFDHGGGEDRNRRTVSYNRKIGMHGQLLNSAGRPIAGAEVAVLTRDLDDDDYRVRTTVRTDGDGRFAYRATSWASRLYQFAWRSHTRDARFAANDYVSLKATASAGLSVRPRVARVGGRIVLTGSLNGKKPRRGVDIVAQGRVRGGRYTTFADGRAGTSGRFRVSYRFQDRASRGRSFSFRVKIGRDSRFAYERGYSRRGTVRVR